MSDKDERGRWAKKGKEDNKDLVLKKIEEKDRKYSELKKLNFSDPTLSIYLKELIKDGYIEFYEDPKDRRVKWYQIKQESKQKVEAKLLKYDAIRFIESIKDPTYQSKTSEDKKVRASIFVSSVEEPYQKGWQRIVDAQLENCYRLAKKLIPLPTKPGLKIAVIFTKES